MKGLRCVRCLFEFESFGVISGERLAIRPVLVAIFGVISGVWPAMCQVLVEYLV